jgi:hypothetical protein
VVQVGPRCATCAQGSRGPQHLYGPGTARSKVDPPPNIRHRCPARARRRVCWAHGASTIEGEGRHTTHTGQSPSSGTASAAPGSKEARVAQGSNRRSYWTHSTHHGGHAADMAEHETRQQRHKQAICVRGAGCGRTWPASVGAVCSCCWRMRQLSRCSRLLPVTSFLPTPPLHQRALVAE